jgi:hypothetical protein
MEREILLCERCNSDIDKNKSNPNRCKCKPEVKLVGENGNVFNLMAICQKALRRAGMHDEAKEMVDKITHCDSYDKALSIMMEYVDAY